MRSRLAAVFGWFVVSGASSAAIIKWSDGLAILACGCLSLVLPVSGVVAFVNLLRHEGWSVVLDAHGIELPRAPVYSARRERIPWSAVTFVGLSPASADRAECVVFHVAAPGGYRHILQRDLVTGTVADIARLAIERVSELRGRGTVAHVEYPR
jgi:hypothetical protein